MVANGGTMQDFNFSCKSLPCAIRTSEKKQLRYIYICIYIHNVPFGKCSSSSKRPPTPEKDSTVWILQILGSLTIPGKMPQDEWVAWLFFSPGKNHSKKTPKGIHSDGRSFFFPNGRTWYHQWRKGMLYSPSGWIRFSIVCALSGFSFLRFYFWISSGREGVVFEKSAALLLRR